MSTGVTAWARKNIHVMQCVLTDAEFLDAERLAREFVLRDESARASGPMVVRSSTLLLARYTRQFVGEIGVARMLGVGHIDAIEFRQYGHLEHRIFVRVVDSEKNGLVIKDRDIDGKAYVLAHVAGRTVNALGWARMGADARAEANIINPPPGSTGEPLRILAQGYLNPMADMIARIAELNAIANSSLK